MQQPWDETIKFVSDLFDPFCVSTYLSNSAWRSCCQLIHWTSICIIFKASMIQYHRVSRRLKLLRFILPQFWGQGSDLRVLTWLVLFRSLSPWHEGSHLLFMSPCDLFSRSVLCPFWSLPVRTPVILDHSHPYDFVLLSLLLQRPSLWVQSHSETKGVQNHNINLEEGSKIQPITLFFQFSLMWISYLPSRDWGLSCGILLIVLNVV